MPIDISKLSPEAQDALRTLDARVLLELKWAMVHAATAHPDHPNVVQSTDLCEDSVMIVCGAKVYAKILNLQQQLKELHATTLTEVVIGKAKAGA